MSESKNIEYTTSISNIVLTEFQDSDGPAIVELLGNDTEIHKNVRYLPQPYTLQNALEFIHLYDDLKKKYNRIINFAIKEKSSGKLIGSCGFGGSDLSSTSTEIEIGYWIGQKYWGKGIGTSIIQTLLHIGFDEYKYSKINAIVFEWNIASQKILIKNGFQKEKFLKNYLEKDGKLINAIKFIRTKT
ncbi:acyl-CoA N-acyltransferase [Neocallimastix lanati (nom. inval.)]|jgi:ribosomal-protein-alanine N-acetyltransferase|uniref:Acyl-CoA N-acyltransferase n=1 Tax=Neocallimastix californiae TaxID=1754190 RepID=A0A1Y2F6P8_9FUNG|nr:acyl-CoA N-acyltransferase [Neocallimastix sp. JGI-2020a]ORY79572.1 acyl-CoA N-acyltransferase [Neocallimastix californiae]|eukprot:ORY79572.1 acyl-CoA N-acyltransferase [Neocallimastix californiae]